MIIRKMTIRDYENVYALWVTTEGMGINTTDDSKEGIARFLKRNPRTCYLAENDISGLVDGSILCGHDGRRGYIYHLAVKASCRGRGIGRALVEKALIGLKRDGIGKVALVVFEENNSGNMFWERVGFSRRNDLIYRNLALVETDKIDFEIDF